MLQPTVFVDLGLTLLETDRDPISKEGWSEVDRQLVIVPTFVKVRPSAREFLQKLRAAGRYITTFSSTDTDTQFAYLETANLADLVDDMGGDEPYSYHVDAPWVLVDDDELPEAKLAFLGIHRGRMSEEEYLRQVAAHHVRCSQFSQFIDSTDREPLTGLCAQIEEKLARQ